MGDFQNSPVTHTDKIADDSRNAISDVGLTILANHDRLRPDLQPLSSVTTENESAQTMFNPTFAAAPEQSAPELNSKVVGAMRFNDTDDRLLVPQSGLYGHQHTHTTPPAVLNVHSMAKSEHVLDSIRQTAENDASKSFSQPAQPFQNLSKSTQPLTASVDESEDMHKEPEREKTYAEFQEEIKQKVREKDDMEKREMILLFWEKHNLEKVQVPQKFLGENAMNCDLQEMRWWYYKLIRDTRINDEVNSTTNTIVQATRFGLFINSTIGNPLNLRLDSDFPNELASVLNTKLRRHLRDHIKSRCGVGGPKPNPLKHLAQGIFDTTLNYHRTKVSMEENAKRQKEAAQQQAARQQAPAFNAYQSMQTMMAPRAPNPNVNMKLAPPTVRQAPNPFQQQSFQPPPRPRPPPPPAPKPPTRVVRPKIPSNKMRPPVTKPTKPLIHGNMTLAEASRAMQKNIAVEKKLKPPSPFRPRPPMPKSQILKPKPAIAPLKNLRPPPPISTTRLKTHSNPPPPKKPAKKKTYDELMQELEAEYDADSDSETNDDLSTPPEAMPGMSTNDKLSEAISLMEGFIGNKDKKVDQPVIVADIDDILGKNKTSSKGPPVKSLAELRRMKKTKQIPIAPKRRQRRRANLEIVQVGAESAPKTPPKTIVQTNRKGGGLGKMTFSSTRKNT